MEGANGGETALHTHSIKLNDLDFSLQFSHDYAEQFYKRALLGVLISLSAFLMLLWAT